MYTCLTMARMCMAALQYKKRQEKQREKNIEN